MRFLAVLTALVLVLTTPACSRFQRPKGLLEPSPTPDTLVSHRGISMPLPKAVRGISFRPFLPSHQIVDVALVAPLGGKDNRKNRGIAFEYASGGQLLVLSEWPINDLRVDFGPTRLGASPCTLIKYADDGVLWTTPRHLVMTLIPDGKIKPSHLSAEARRLLSRGACP
ncbi:MAG: hypothetical protein ABR584_00960 [Candidatus Baltobacteraceae bacterium]